MDNLTPEFNTQNVNYIRKQIEQKTSDRPYFANNNTVTHTVTDMDHHPYTRWYRGVYYYPEPIVFEREAGYRRLENNCYNLSIPSEVGRGALATSRGGSGSGRGGSPDPDPQLPLEKPNDPRHCFEAACSIQYPCYPEYLQKFADKDALDIMLNKACIVQYR